jgi:glutaredoxin-like protein NrdH
MGVKHVEGEKGADVMVYALSTCGWCRKTKRLLSSLGIEYDYIDVDLLKGQEEERVMKEVEKWNPKCSFPTVVVNGKCIVGFEEERIRKAVGDGRR